MNLALMPANNWTIERTLRFSKARSRCNTPRHGSEKTGFELSVCSGHAINPICRWRIISRIENI